MNTGALLIAATAAFGITAAQAEDIACPEGDCETKVVLDARTGRCAFAEPSTEQKLKHAKPGHRVRWNVENQCPNATTVSIPLFRVHPKETCTDPANHAKHIKERKDKNPFESNCPLRVAVKGGGGKDKIECRVKKNALAPRTYKYDITTSGGLKLDPEIEIIH